MYGLQVFDGRHQPHSTFYRTRRQLTMVDMGRLAIEQTNQL